MSQNVHLLKPLLHHDPFLIIIYYHAKYKTPEQSAVCLIMGSDKL